MQPAKRLRLRSKTTCTQTQTTVLKKGSEHAAEEVAGARKSVYLLTFPHPRQEASSDGVHLVAPETLSRETLLEKVKDCFANPTYVDIRSKGAGNSFPLYNAVVFLDIRPSACLSKRI